MHLVDYSFIAIMALLVVCCFVLVADMARQHLRKLALTTLTLCCCFCYLLVTADVGESYFFSDLANNKNQGNSRAHSASQGKGGKGGDPVAGKDATGPGDGWGRDQASANIELVGGPPNQGDDDASGGSAGVTQKSHNDGAADGRSNDATGAAEASKLILSAADLPGSLRDCPDCPELALVPPGELEIGSPPAEMGRFRHEGPRRRVTIPRPFYIGRFEVTVGEFDAFARRGAGLTVGGCVVDHVLRYNADFRNPGIAQNVRHPVVCVSWDDAKAYAAFLSQTTKQRYRLPTEAEWEHAARLDLDPAREGLDAIERAAITFKLKHNGTTEGGLHAPGRLGIHDLAGNVWELVEDCWQPSHAAMPLDGTARKLQSDQPCPLRTMRGGAWYNEARHVRAAARWANPASIGGNGVGFRILREVDVIHRRAAEAPSAGLAAMSAPPAPIATQPSQARQQAGAAPGRKRRHQR